jgi:hypothetical protein
MASKEPDACVRQQSKNQHPACFRKAHRFVLQGKSDFKSGVEFRGLSLASMSPILRKIFSGGENP